MGWQVGTGSPDARSRLPTRRAALDVARRPTGKERSESNNMKYLTLIILAAVALSFSGCANDDQQTHTHASHSAATTSYGK